MPKFCENIENYVNFNEKQQLCFIIRSCKNQKFTITLHYLLKIIQIKNIYNYRHSGCFYNIYKLLQESIYIHHYRIIFELIGKKKTSRLPGG